MGYPRIDTRQSGSIFKLSTIQHTILSLILGFIILTVVNQS